MELIVLLIPRQVLSDKRHLPDVGTEVSVDSEQEELPEERIQVYLAEVFFIPDIEHIILHVICNDGEDIQKRDCPP